MKVTLDHSFVRCWNLDTSEGRSEICGKIWNVVLDKDGEDHLDWSHEKWKITESQGAQNILHTCTCTIKRRTANRIGHFLSRQCLLKQGIKENIEGKIGARERRERRSKLLLDDVTHERGYCKLKAEVTDGTLWRTRFEWGYGPDQRQPAEWK
jgi:hypothetical protein